MKVERTMESILEFGRETELREWNLRKQAESIIRNILERTTRSLGFKWRIFWQTGGWEIQFSDSTLSAYPESPGELIGFEDNQETL